MARPSPFQTGLRLASALAAGTVVTWFLLAQPADALATGTNPTTSDWAVAYQLDQSHDGSIAHDTLTPPLSRLWTANLGAPSSYPLIANGHVFVTTGSSGTGNKLYALSLSSGSIAWGPVDLGGTYWDTTAAYEAGRVFTINGSGKVQAFDENTGASLWSVQLPGQYSFSAPPTAYNGTVYVGGAGSGGTLYAVRESDGVVLWTGSVMNGDQSSPAVNGTGVYVSYACAQAYDFSPITGAMIWHHNTSCEGGGGKTSVLANGQLYVRDAILGNVVLNATSGNGVGSFSANRAPAISGTRGYFLNGTTLTAVDLTSNASLWTFTGDGALSAAPLVVNGLIYLGSTNGNLYALDQTGAQVWTANVGSPINAPDEQNVSQPLTGLGAGDGYLVVPAGNTVNLYGGNDSLYPGDASWGAQVVGQSTSAATFTLVDNSVSALQVAGIAVTGDYSQSNNCTATLAPGASCTISVTFTPTSTGPRTGTLTVTDNAAGSPHVSALSGAGVVLGPPARLVLSPATATITAGGSYSFTAEAFDSNGYDLGDVTTATTFSIDSVPCSANACSSTVAGSHTVTGQDGSATGTAALSITAAPIDHITLAPATATVTAGSAQAYSVEGFDQYGNDLGTDPGASLTIAPDGSCQSGSCLAGKAGVHSVTATDGSKTASASLTVNPGPPATLAVTPSTATIAAGGSQSYAAEAFDSSGDDLGDVTASTTFALDGAPCSANTCSGSVSGTHTVSAKDGSASGSATLMVNPGGATRLVVSPATTTVTAGAYVSYQAEAYDAAGNDLGTVTSSATWSIDQPGVTGCNGSGCSSTVAGQRIVTASYQGITGAASMTVNPGPAVRLGIGPGMATIAAGGAQSFDVKTLDGYNNAVADVATSTNFAITPSGSCSGNTCTASQAAYTYTVTASYSGLSATATLHVTPGPFDHLTISPATQSTTAGKYVVFSVFAVDQYGNPTADAINAIWAITPEGDCSVGPASASCTSTIAGPHSLTATALGKSVSAALAVTPGPVTRIRIAPIITSMAAGSSQAFTARTVDGYENTVADVTASTTFAITPGGSCSGNICTAATSPTTNGNVTGSYNGMTDLINIAVTPGPVSRVNVSPANATITAGQGQAYTASAYDAYGNLIGDITSGATFAISPDGSCTSATCAATKAGAHAVTATYQAKTGSATLTVNAAAAASLSINPTSLTVVVGQSATLTASAADAYGNAVGTTSVAWSLSSGTPGKVSAATGTTTTFTASSTSTGTGKATASMGTLSVSAPVSVVPAAPTKLEATANGGHKANLTWASGPGASSYTIYRRTGTGAWMLLKSGVTSTTYTDSNLTAGQSYSYYVIAVGKTGLNSSPSNTATVVAQG